MYIRRKNAIFIVKKKKTFDIFFNLLLGYQPLEKYFIRLVLFTFFRVLLKFFQSI